MFSLRPVRCRSNAHASRAASFETSESAAHRRRGGDRRQLGRAFLPTRSSAAPRSYRVNRASRFALGARSPSELTRSGRKASARSSRLTCCWASVEPIARFRRCRRFRCRPRSRPCSPPGSTGSLPTRSACFKRPRSSARISPCPSSRRSRLKGELLLKQEPPALDEAERCFGLSLDVARRQQAKSLELRTATSLSRLWRGRGKPAEARDLLAKTYGWFTQGFDTADLEAARALLDA